MKNFLKQMECIWITQYGEIFLKSQTLVIHHSNHSFKSNEPNNSFNNSAATTPHAQCNGQEEDEGHPQDDDDEEEEDRMKVLKSFRCFWLLVSFSLTPLPTAISRADVLLLLLLTIWKRAQGHVVLLRLLLTVWWLRRAQGHIIKNVVDGDRLWGEHFRKRINEFDRQIDNLTNGEKVGKI
jgi:hypothetical protein